MKKLKKQNKEIIEKFIEEGADLEHRRWAGWQKYLFSKCSETVNDNLIIPADLVDRWTKQINTPYSKLSEEEKESDRKEVRKYIPLLEKALFQQKEKIKRVILDKIDEDYKRRGITIYELGDWINNNL